MSSLPCQYIAIRTKHKSIYVGKVINITPRIVLLEPKPAVATILIDTRGATMEYISKAEYDEHYR